MDAVNSMNIAVVRSTATVTPLGATINRGFRDIVTIGDDGRVLFED